MRWANPHSVRERFGHSIATRPAFWRHDSRGRGVEQFAPVRRTDLLTRAPERPHMSNDATSTMPSRMHADQPDEPAHDDEPHASGGTEGKLNWLRASVLGADDGIVSVAGIVLGVAGATSARGRIFTAGLAGLVAGTVSMALGEFVSVSSQRDSETALVVQEKHELQTMPVDELAELSALYEAKGLSEDTAQKVAEELTAHDALAAHLDVELNIDQSDLASPFQAAAASAFSFTLGALLPLVRDSSPSSPIADSVTFLAVLVALGTTGAISARIGGSSPRKAVIRVVLGGTLGLAFTYGVGRLFGSVIR